MAKDLLLTLEHGDDTDCPNYGMVWSIPVPEFQYGLIWIPTLLCTGGCEAEARIVGREWVERDG